MGDETYPYEISRGSGTETAYAVEARIRGNHAMPIGKQIFDTRWQRVEVKNSLIGVPSAAPYSHAPAHGLFGYSAAQALRWWFIANAEQEGRGAAICLETRIIKYIIHYTHRVEAVSDHAYIGAEDRSHMMPDWGKSP